MARAINAALPARTASNGSLLTQPHARGVTGLILCLFHLFAPLVRAIPIVPRAVGVLEDDDLPMGPDDPDLWIYLSTAIVLVLLGGIFAGLTIALMGQDEIYLQVIASSGEGRERKNAARVLRLLKRGKHWVLVTLLLSNVITNETLPIVLDRSLGGGWPAVLSSTVLIVIFGEVVPQSICVRYGLPIGAWCSPLVLGLMYIMAPVAWPTAKLLDYLLGEDHGTTYKKAGLKTLVTLHKTLGTIPDERLNEDEVTIITAVLDLKAKPVGSIMTPMKDVFIMSADAVLDEEMMNAILSAGYSRIPIHTPGNPRNFVGMLLVKMLITYDPEDALRVRDFALATLPETRPSTSCLDIINFFQEGKSHMVLVSDYPGESFGAVGVVTLEDVIEELIGEEIIDESDVFVDVHKAIRRMAPAPRARIPKGEIITDSRRPSVPKKLIDLTENGDSETRKPSQVEMSSSPKISSFLVQRRSSGHNSNHPPLPIDDADVMQHLKHLGPSNAAQRPKSTRINTVKIKPGIPETVLETSQPAQGETTIPSHAPQGGVGEGLLDSAGLEASDAVHSLAVGYGTIGSGGYGAIAPDGDRVSWKSGRSGSRRDDAPTSPKSNPDEQTKLMGGNKSPENSRPQHRTASTSTIGSLHSSRSKPRSPPRRTQTARSGSISENIIDMNGVRKIVLETTSSSDSEEKIVGTTDGTRDRPRSSEAESKHEDESRSGGKKKRKKRGKKKKTNGEGSDSQPLLGSDGR